MKSCLFMLFFVLCIFSGNASDRFIITVVRGGCFLVKGSSLKVGDQISDTETIRFSSLESFVIVLNSTGRFIISPKMDGKKIEGELLILAKEYIRIHAENVRLSSRATESLADISDYFVSDLTVNDKILFVGPTKLSISNFTTQKVDNTETFFFLQKITGDSHVSNKLFVQNDSLIMKEADFVFGGTPFSASDGKIILAFLEGYSQVQQVRKIAEISPTFLSEKEVLSVMRAIKSALNGLSKTAVFDEIYTEFYYLYGKPDKSMLERLYEKV